MCDLPRCPNPEPVRDIGMAICCLDIAKTRECQDTFSGFLKALSEHTQKKAPVSLMSWRCRLRKTSNICVRATVIALFITNHSLVVVL